MIYLIAVVLAFVLGGLFFGAGVGRSALSLMLAFAVAGLAFYLLPWWLALITIGVGYFFNMKAVQMHFNSRAE